MSSIVDPLDRTTRAQQLLMVAVPLQDPGAGAELVGTDHVGGVFLQGRSNRGVSATAADVRALQARARTPLLVSIDQEGGQVQSLSGPGVPAVPSALVQGRDGEATLAAGTRAWSAALGEAGVTLNLAPVADVVPAGTAAQNPPIGAFQREYGSDPAAVAADVATVVTSSQAAGVDTTAKHFPGLGRVRVNTDSGTGAVDDTTTAQDPALAPFRAAISAGTAAIMISLASYPALDANNLAVFSEKIITGLLRDTMGFGGLVVSDDLGAARAVASTSPAQRAVRFVRAGGDLVLTVQPTDVAPMTAALVVAQQDPAFAARVEDAVARVATAKCSRA
ncbi:MAG: glycoside hydrolase family 3 N-terminal domain-containing protein [Mycobacteriaceae bacterium]